MRSISLIVAMDERRLIGQEGRLPWRLPNDMKLFRALTLGKTVLMGRKTWDSLGKPLADRDNWVLTRDDHFRPEGCRVFHRIDDALAAHTEGELMVIGGGELYAQTLPRADRLYITQVHTALEGDAWFPPFDIYRWREVERSDHAADERHAYAYSFVTLERI